LLTWPAAAARLDELGGTGRRTVVGIAGPPGAGKSTLAAWLVERATVPVALVPMDGFHRTNAELERRGLLSRKGAPDTFDLPGYLRLLRQLHGDDRRTVHAPAFDRSIDEPTADGIAIAPAVRVVLTEGNYLLYDRDGWHEVADQLNETWWLSCADDERSRRLVERHQSFGRSAEDAIEFVARSDQANAALIADDLLRADFVLESHRAPLLADRG
jgi:pantothenate kinase